MNASCVHPIAMRVRRAEMVRAVIDRCSACEHDVEWVFAGDRDWPQGDALHVTGSADALAAASQGDERHEHYWVDARDDETGWHCVICGLTEYPGDDAEDEPPREWDARLFEYDRVARLVPAASSAAAASQGDEGLREDDSTGEADADRVLRERRYECPLCGVAHMPAVHHSADELRAWENSRRAAASQGDEGLLLAKYPKRAFATEAGDRLLAMNAGRDSAVVQWLTNDIRAIEQEEYDKIRAALAAEEERG